jgi:hypothetical protein
VLPSRVPGVCCAWQQHGRQERAECCDTIAAVLCNTNLHSMSPMEGWSKSTWEIGVVALPRLDIDKLGRLCLTADANAARVTSGRIFPSLRAIGRLGRLGRTTHN